MDNFDANRKTLDYYKVKRGLNTKHGFFAWYTFSIILFLINLCFIHIFNR